MFTLGEVNRSIQVRAAVLSGTEGVRAVVVAIVCEPFEIGTFYKSFRGRPVQRGVIVRVGHVDDSSARKHVLRWGSLAGTEKNDA